MKFWVKIWVSTSLAVAIAILALAIAEPGRKRCRDLEGACLLAAGNARTTLAWLVPGHPRREAGLLLLSRDAAWAPVCAKDPRVGDQLRNQILDATGNAEALNARPLAERLIVVLERR